MSKQNLKRNFPVSGLCAALCAAVLAAGCTEKTEAPVIVEAAPVSVAAVSAGTGFPVEIQAAGSVVADLRVEAASRLAAYIRDVPHREGDRVKKGDVVARLDPKDVDAAVRTASAKVEVAKAALRDAELDQSKYSALYKEGLVSNNDWRKVTLKRDSAKSDLEQARAALANAEGERVYVTVTAPADGTIVRVARREGDMAVPGMPIVVIDSDADPRFEFEVSQKARASVRPGVVANVLVDGFEKPFTGEVERVTESADRISRSWLARVKFPAEVSAELRPGMYGRVLIHGEGETSRAWVPLEALTNRGGLDGVFVISDGRARFQWLRIGEKRDGRAEVLAGVKGDERLVRNPTEFLVDGARVREE
ncbi:efflux RND transporter periplasmic adaptor subunit [Sutterella sp.]|uniref:efflux RND transporter periplasmic adaptor subunit n=1 Tax=Sutterella sp. TaxID=1981025 RepID=UPI0026DED24A|nr:efflux RND transporter periplasmic adaptor subunit [Sutterella sp.]MDO5531471.1 efflux RND transporter periplasmic adaptor subunit [Sutterella sp.]